MQALAPIIRDLAVILGTAGIVTLIFQKIHQPVVLGYLVAGMIVGPNTPPEALVSDVPNIKIIAELGVIFLMFSLGLEFSFHKLTKVGFSASVTGFLEVVFMILIGFITGTLLGWSYYDSIFLGAALAISSTTIIIKALEELHLKRKKFADVVFGILIVEDLLAILLIVALSTIRTQNVFSFLMLSTTVKLFTVVIGWVLVGYFLVPTLFRRIGVFANSETLTIVSIALCLMLAVIAASFNYSSALGAFIMGSILAETPQSERIIELIKPIRDIFAAVFFVSVGMLIDPTMIITHWPIVILLSVVTVIGKIITSGGAAFLTGQTVNNSVRIGFSMAQIGEFSFIIVSLGTAMNVISVELYAIIVAVSAITTFTTPYLIKLSTRLNKEFDKRLSETTKTNLNRYSHWMYELFIISHEKKLRNYAIMRFVINGFIVAIIFAVDDYILVPSITSFIVIQEGVIQSLSWLLSFVLASPFIWAMAFYYPYSQWHQKKFKLDFPFLLGLFITLIEIGLLSIGYFYSWTVTLIVSLISVIYFILFFKKLKKCYRWFEKRFINNIGFNES